MLELLRTPQVEKVLSVGRRSVRINEYPLTVAEKVKLEEYIIPDFMELKAGDEHFDGYDAVYFIAGITSIGNTSLASVVRLAATPRSAKELTALAQSVMEYHLNNLPSFEFNFLEGMLLP